MKNLQKNNPTIGAQGYNLVDKASEDIYVHPISITIDGLNFGLYLKGNYLLGIEDDTGKVYQIEDLYLHNTAYGNDIQVETIHTNPHYNLHPYLTFPQLKNGEKGPTVDLISKEYGKIGSYNFTGAYAGTSTNLIVKPTFSINTSNENIDKLYWTNDRNGEPEDTTECYGISSYNRVTYDPPILGYGYKVDLEFTFSEN